MKLEVQNAYGFDNRLDIHTYNQQKSNMLFWGPQGIAAGTSGFYFISREIEELKKGWDLGEWGSCVIPRYNTCLMFSYSGS